MLHVPFLTPVCQAKPHGPNRESLSREEWHEPTPSTLGYKCNQYQRYGCGVSPVKGVRITEEKFLLTNPSAKVDHPILAQDDGTDVLLHCGLTRPPSLSPIIIALSCPLPLKIPCSLSCWRLPICLRLANTVGMNVLKLLTFMVRSLIGLAKGHLPGP